MVNESNKVYVEMLVRTLQQKSELLDSVLEFNRSQEQLFGKEQFDYELFDSLTGNKQVILDEINELDQVFESNYERVKDELKESKALFRNEIEIMQKVITKLTDKAVAINASELRIKSGMEVTMTKLKKKVKQFHTSNKSINQYYKNMANQHIGQSYFLDKKNKKLFNTIKYF